MTNDEPVDPERELRGFAVPLPANLGAMLAHQHDRDHLEADSFQVQVYNFLDGLEVEQLMVLRRMFAADGKSQIANYWEGMVVTVLRLVHQVNPDTGLTVEQALEKATQGAPPVDPA